MGAPTILIVDDDEIFLAELRHVLSLAGFHTRVARTGRGALAVLQDDEDKIDLLIVDLLLPDIDGFQVMGAVSRRNCRFKTLAMSNVYRKPLLAEIADTLGADAFVEKCRPDESINADEWVQTVRRLLPGSASQRATFFNA